MDAHGRTPHGRPPLWLTGFGRASLGRSIRFVCANTIPATSCGWRNFSSVNAKQFERPVFQAGLSRCESDHGYQF